MRIDELLGSDNRSRLEELTKADSSVETITSNLPSQDQSIRRDAALLLVSRSHDDESASPGPADTERLIHALIKTLELPSAAAAAAVFGGEEEEEESGNDGNGPAAANAAEAALAALYVVLRRGGEDKKGGGADDDALLLAIAAYTEADQPWTTETAASTARLLLDMRLSDDSTTTTTTTTKKQDFIINGVLQRHLRPLFSKTASSSLTAEGRPALFRQAPPEGGGGGFQLQRAAWKEAGPHNVTIFNWAVKSSEPATLNAHWPLYVPVLVTLVEDDDIATRRRGLDILGVFLAACDPQHPVLLRSSGIDAVFRESVFPSLLFLPSLTPEAESVAVLRAAYAALLALALAEPEPAAERRRALLDRMLRDGVMAGYFHASQHIRVVEVLMQSAARIVESLQVYAVKHLQSLLDLYAPVLTDAFALIHAPAVLAAAQALNVTILNCWPRIVGTPHAEQIINIVSRSWINIYDSSDISDTTRFDSLTAELTRTMTLLAALWKQSGERVPTKKLAQVVSKAPNLAPLFEPFHLEVSAAR